MNSCCAPNKIASISANFDEKCESSSAVWGVFWRGKKRLSSVIFAIARRYVRTKSVPMRATIIIISLCRKMHFFVATCRYSL